MTAPYIERMKYEFRELADRIAKLSAFIVSSPIFKHLPADERDLMQAQLGHMRGYHDVLETRIDLAERSQ